MEKEASPRPCHWHERPAHREGVDAGRQRDTPSPSEGAEKLFLCCNPQTRRLMRGDCKFPASLGYTGRPSLQTLRGGGRVTRMVALILNIPP